MPNKDPQRHDKKRKSEEDSTKISSLVAPWNGQKKSRKSPTSSSNNNNNNNHEIFPIDLWENILCFLDVPDLGKCALLSKEINAMTKNDAVWESHVRKLLKNVFDGAFYLEPYLEAYYIDHLPMPLLERSLKSASFRLWFEEWETPHYGALRLLTKKKAAVRGCFKKTDGTKIKIGDNTMMSGGEPDESYRWLVEDVPLCIYYKKAATFALNNCKAWGMEYGYPPSNVFHGMPNIRLFHGLGGSYYYRYTNGLRRLHVPL